MGDEHRRSDFDEKDTEPSESDDPGDGIVSVRGGLVGLGFIWLTAMAAFGAIGAAAYGLTESASYLLVAVFAGGIAVTAGSKSLQAFGYR